MIEKRQIPDFGPMFEGQRSFYFCITNIRVGLPPPNLPDFCNGLKCRYFCAGLCRGTLITASSHGQQEQEATRHVPGSSGKIRGEQVRVLTSNLLSPSSTAPPRHMETFLTNLPITKAIKRIFIASTTVVGFVGSCLGWSWQCVRCWRWGNTWK